MSQTSTGGIRTPPKDPSDIVDYGFIFTGDGLGSSEAITGTPTVVITAIAGDLSPLTFGTVTLSGSPAQTISVFFSAGTAGFEYTVSVTFTTNASRTFQRSFRLPVVDQ
jgi:hypothetical protein